MNALTSGGVSRRAVLGCLAGAALSACRRGTTLRTLRLGTLPRFTLAPLFLANELGFFRDASLALDAQFLETTQTIPLLAAGRIDVSVGGATPALFNAIAQGARTRIVAARENAVPNCSEEVFGHRASFPDGFDRASQIRGKHVAVTAPTSMSAFLLDVLLESAGVQTSDVQLAFMRPSESAPALIAGLLDVVVDVDMGFTSPAVVTGPSVAPLLPGFNYSFFHFGRALIDGDVGVGAAFLIAYFRGVQEFLKGKVPSAMDMLARGSGMTPALARTACRKRLSTDGEVNLDSVKRSMEWARKKQFLRSDVDVAQVFDRRFLEAALG